MKTSLGRELKRGTLELIILQLLKERPKYGYELVSELDRGGEGRPAPSTIKEGTVYPVLYRLEDQSLVEAEWQPRERGVPRKYYKLTDEGRNRLALLLEEWSDFSRWVTSLVSSSSEGLEEESR
jgi:PadR family transcriptional regulator PadR